MTAKNTFDYSGRLLTQSRDDGQNTAYTYDGLGRTATQSLPTGMDSDKKNKKNGNGAGPHLTGCGVGGTTPGCPGPGDLTMFAGDTARVFNDGLTPIAWATANLSTNLVYGPQGADHQVTTSSTRTVTSWLYLDRQKTVRATAGADGVTTAASAFTDFGSLEPAAGTLYAGAGTEAAPGQEDKYAAVHLPVTTTKSPVGNTGEQANPAAGLSHYYARDYQPGAASWIQADTWAGNRAQPGTLNKYTYVLNNPTSLIDFLGNRPCAYEYNNGCHDKPQYIAPPAPVVPSTPITWVPQIDDQSGGTSETVDWTGGGASGAAMQAAPGQRSGWYQGGGAADCLLGDPGSVVECLLHPITSQFENGLRDFQDQIAAIDAWVAQNMSAGASFSYCFGGCGEIGVSTSGWSLGFGLGPRVGASFQFGVEAFGASGWSQGASCEASVGPVGVYVGGSKTTGGYSVNAGYAPGAELGCSVMARYEWSWQ